MIIQVTKCEECKNKETMPGHVSTAQALLQGGMPLCINCGGIGVTMNTEDFSEGIDKVRKLFNDFFPFDATMRVSRPMVVKMQKFQFLCDGVSEHYKNHQAIAISECFAEMIFNGGLADMVSEFKKEIDEELAEVSLDANYVTAEGRIMKPLYIQAYSGDFKGLRESLRIVLEQHPNSITVLGHSSLLYVRVFDDFAKAEQCLRKALEIDPDNEDYFLRLLSGMYLSHKWGEVITMIDDWMKKKSCSPKAANMLLEMRKKALEKSLEEN